MASSSSFTSCDDNKRYQYDVFLSFSGEDTRRTFVDHLNEALQRHGIRTFKDDERLQKGREIKDELLTSIEDSKFCIIVFSKKYASSSWCLDELVKIMECHKTTYQTAFPVFYDVEPTEVRKQTGLVGEAFAKHTRKVVIGKTLTRSVGKALARHSNKKLGKWRKALKDAANLCGWELKNTAHGHEAKVIKVIVERISLELRSINMGVDENLIGMEQRMQDLDSYLEIGLNDVRMIGIKGMGGAGKTTLSQAIFDKISFNFEGKSFVENVREKSKAPLFGLHKLQEQLLRDVFKDSGISVSGVHEGKKLIKTMLCGKKVLIVLDDVDHKDQLEALARDPKWFKPGSRIIITTRDEQVLIAHGVKWIYDVTLLSDEEALHLLHMHAFLEGIPSEEYEMESLKVVQYAAGLPLTIKVLGSFLCGKDKPEWMEALARLEKIPLKETLEKLELSYESLEDEYKEMFLDIACFNTNWNKEEATRVLESCGFHAINGLRVLEQRCLITIDKLQNLICMHDHIVEMGMDIVRRKHRDEPHKHSRLWVQEEVERVLANDSCTKETRCIRLLITPTIDLDGLESMKRLRFLQMYPLNFNDLPPESDESFPYLPNSLQYLYWYGFRYRCLPKSFEANNIVSLEMRFSKIKQLWEGGKVMKQLKFLDLSDSELLRSLDLGLMPNLERLELTGCGALVKLYLQDGKVMNKLKVLSLGFTKLRSLDLGSMPNLERLELPFCYQLVKLYVHGGCLKSLLYLDLHGCDNIKSFLFIEQLESLHTVRLNLWESPDYIITWHFNNSLQELHLDALYISYANVELPESICSLQHLRVLKLSFFELPEGIGRLECLETLDIRYADVEHLPRSICMLNRLKTLHLESCPVLEQLSEDVGQLESLVGLYLIDCDDLRDIPTSICNLKHLKMLMLRGCKRLEKLPERLGDLECLQELDVEHTDIIHLPPNLSLLNGLKIYRSELKGQTIDDDIIDLFCSGDDTKKLQIQGFQNLRTLDLHICGVDELPEALGHLECLEELNLSYTDIKHLPDSICMLKHLRSLKLVSIPIWELPEGIGRLECLETLDIRYANVEHLPRSICMLKHLRSLKLVSIPIWELPEDVGQLECLETLDIRYANVEQLPRSICMLKRLKTLHLERCPVLEKLSEDVGQLESLVGLYLIDCNNLTDIPTSICNLKHLNMLMLRGCKRLEKLPKRLGDLECLQELDIKDTGIIHLPPNLSLLNGLKIYRSELKDQIIGDDFIHSLCSGYDSKKLQIQGFQNLRTLDLRRCDVDELSEALGHLECLEELNLSDTDIKHLPDSICMLKHLRKLFLQHCVLLEKLPDDVGQLESLEELSLSRCYSIREIPNSICMLKHLQKLDIRATGIAHLPWSSSLLKGLKIYR